MDAPLRFEWDDAEARRNLQKHGMPFDEAIAAFSDPNKVLIDVSRLSDGKRCSKVIGLIDGVLFAVVYTARGDNLRLISARPTNKQDERSYGDRHLHL